MHSPRTNLPLMQRQRGAAFIVMLVIMIMGVTIVLVSALSKVTLQTARNEKSADMLAQAKEALVGYAISGGTRPGDMPYQDRLVTPTEDPATTDGHPNYDGSQDGCPGSNGCLGRLPWRTLKLSINSPSENDPIGFMPWYAVSGNLIDSLVTLNSELLNTDNSLHGPNNYPAPPHPWLTVRDMNGNVLSDRVAFVIIIPGAALPGQSRPAASITPPISLGGANQYLDSITVGGVTYDNAGGNNEFIMGDEHRWIDDPANPGKQIEDSTYNFNDKLIYVTIDELMPLIEKRIARDVKKCLDDYAVTSAAKYPWAAPITDLTYATTPNTLFGRVPDSPVYLVTDPSLTGLLNNLQTALNSLQSAVNACQTSDSTTNINNLTAAGNAVQTAMNNITTPPFPSSSALTSLRSNANAAGKAAIPTSAGGSTYSNPCDYIKDNVGSVVETKLNNITSGNYIANISASAPEDASMQQNWPAGCFLTPPMSNYWPDWKRLVLYQVANGYKPGTASPSCGGGGNCLSINGSGNPNSGTGTYRAAISIAGKKLPGQSRATQTVDQYLELNNQTNKTATPSNLSFDTYKPTDTTNYSTVNDLVLCVDGKTNCQ